MKIINFFSGPGGGKSTAALKLASGLKAKGINCELVTEVAKDVTWDRNFHQLKNQFFIVAKQFDRIRRLEGKVDYIIMDTGLIQNIAYFKDERYKDELTKIMFNLHYSYDNINFFVNRLESYDTSGRKESMDESIAIDNFTIKMLKEHNIKYIEIAPGADILEMVLMMAEV